MFKGAMTALVTPFRGGKVDEPALAGLVEWQIAEGIDALIPAGTTGEAPTLTTAEQAAVIRRVVEVAGRRVPVIAGAGASATAEAIAKAEAARAAGADALLVVTPYYNRPSQEGLYRHYSAIARAVPLPLVLYNVPARTGCDLLPATVARLCDELPSVVGLKEASGSVPRLQELSARLAGRLTLLSGDDSINFPLYAAGAEGCISVVANVAPRLVAAGWDAFAAGDWRQAARLHAESLPLAEALFSEPSPSPAKTALAALGRIDPELRLPLHPMSAAPKERLLAALRGLELLP